MNIPGATPSVVEPETDAAQILISSWHEHRLVVLLVISFALIALGVASRSRRSKVGGLDNTPFSGFQRKAESGGSLDVVSPAKLVGETASKAATAGPVPTISAREPKRILGSKLPRRSTSTESSPYHETKPQRIQPVVFYASLTGDTERHAQHVVDVLRSEQLGKSRLLLEPQLHDLSYIDFDDYFVSLPKSSDSTESTCFFYLILVPSYDIDTVLNTFLSNLQETHHDFRVDTAPLAGLAGYTVFGFGDREGWPNENDGFCYQARDVDKWLAKLTARKRAFPLGLGDSKRDGRKRLDEWLLGVSEVLVQIADSRTLGEGVPGSGDALESGDEDEDMVQENTVLKAKSPKPARTRRSQAKSMGVDDLEDLGRKALQADVDLASDEPSSYPDPMDFTTPQPASSSQAIPTTPKPMVPITSPTHAALTKQGYTIIGSHSGVKICRWTKSALRGRGSCYKRSFYGIASHRCMEATPSLSCSNKCVFCWRHGTNPVGTTWRWQTDPPDLILAGALDAHVRKIKSLRGVPGVRAERFAEAMDVRHCALSLVGEPIFYPHINQLLAMLHAKKISTFLVCNAQHPEQLAALYPPPTQLYVSIDASNKEALRRIDRPLHRDFWERFLRCMDVLRARRHKTRTVFRLTLVKGFNADEADGYADLVARARPCFVEVKGVTYCGTASSSAAGLTMGNVPFHREVADFTVALERALAKRGLAYGVAAEHAHSCCMLLGDVSFRKQGRWHSLIDYERFFELVANGGDFAPEEYMGEETPEWAAFGNGGFDPSDERVDRKGRPVGS